VTRGTRFAAVVLAAGRGQRLGGVAKALLRRPDGAGFLASIQRCAGHAGVTDLLVVAAEPHRRATEAEAARLGLPVVVNPEPDRGMASSVAIGFAAVADRWPEAEAALLWPVDHPYVAAETIGALLAEAGAARVVVPVCGGRGGHPTLFGRDLWPELAACTEAPAGARSVLEAHRQATVRLEVPDPAVTADVDTRADLR
jgi:molybdenum cofactor cytidylyltransferase